MGANRPRSALNICRVTSAFPPPWNGLAPGPYALSLAQFRRGAGITVIARKGAGDSEVDSQAPFPVERVPARYDVQFSLKARERFKALNRARAFDLVHAHGLSAFGFLVRVASEPVFTTFHCVRRAQRRFEREARKAAAGGTGPAAPSRGRLLFEALQERVAALGSDGLVAVSEEVRENLVEEYGVSPGKVFMAGNGVDPVLFSPAEEGARNGAGRLNLLWVGRFTGSKGEADLIAACSMLRGEGVEFRLRMVGDGGWREKALRLIRELGLEGRVEAPAYIPNYRMAEEYRQAHVFVFPSLREGMPKVVLEAMACGCPVVASDIPGCRELVADGRNGFLVPAGSPGRIRDALMRLDGDRGLLCGMGRASRGIIEREHTWDAVARRIEGFYEAVLKERAGPRR